VEEAGDVGTALFAAACLDGDARYPIIDVIATGRGRRGPWR
jgi:hypothetical protein